MRFAEWLGVLCVVVGRRAQHAFECKALCLRPPSQHYPHEVAFQDTLPWQNFSIKWPEVAAGHALYEHLKSLPAAYVENMKAEVNLQRWQTTSQNMQSKT
eukprot:4434091-Amphidinium_carterae.2